MALAVRGRAHLELGETDTARRLILLAVERAPAAPTRYLFARALLELSDGRLDEVTRTTREIRGHALPPDDPDRTEDKAAAYLDGLALLASGDMAGAVESLRQSIERVGSRGSGGTGSGERADRPGARPRASAAAPSPASGRDGGEGPRRRAGSPVPRALESGCARSPRRRVGPDPRRKLALSGGCGSLSERRRSHGRRPLHCHRCHPDRRKSACVVDTSGREACPR